MSKSGRPTSDKMMIMINNDFLIMLVISRYLSTTGLNNCLYILELWAKVCVLKMYTADIVNVQTRRFNVQIQFRPEALINVKMFINVIKIHLQKYGMYFLRSVSIVRSSLSLSCNVADMEEKLLHVLMPYSTRSSV